MLLFQKRFHAGLLNGAVRLTFRSWPAPRVKAGGRYRVHPIGVVEVDAVTKVRLADITEADARTSGFATRRELLEYLAPKLGGRTEVFRVELHHGGDGDRVPEALDARLTAADVERLDERLARLDGAAPWTLSTLRLIGERPRVAASHLAASLGRDTQAFKADVRKLKRLGLTQSFEVGYELSPRGRRYLALREGRRRGPTDAGAPAGAPAPTPSPPRSGERRARGRGRPAGDAHGAPSRGRWGRAGAASRGRR